MQKLFTTAAVILALATPAYAEGMAGPKPAGTMSGPQQTQGGMSGGMTASHDTMAHDTMAKDKKKAKPSAMKHDTMSGPQQSGGGMSGGMGH
jgi:hypothetical protein